MYPYALIDLHCDTLTDCGKGDASKSDTLEDPAKVLSLSAIPQQTHWAQFYAVFTPDQIRGQGAIDYFAANRANFDRQMDKFSDRVIPCRTAGDMERAWAEGKTAAFLTVENGSVLAGRMDQVDVMARAGVKAFTLTWNGENEIGSGHTTDHGLSPFGRAVIPALEERRILVDVSHLNDTGFRQVLDIARRPFVATHSNARAVCPHRRNLTDDMIREMAARKCLIGLNYYVSFLSDRGEATPEDLRRHVEHFFELGAGECLALGSDFDGAHLPEWLNTPGKAAGLYRRFLDWGLTREQAEGILWRNALRSFRENL